MKKVIGVRPMGLDQQPIDQEPYTYVKIGPAIGAVVKVFGALGIGHWVEAVRFVSLII